MNIGIHLLEGLDTTEELKTMSGRLSTNSARLARICSSASSVLWECSKVSPKDQQQGAVADMMRLAGIVEVTAINFEKVRVPNVDYAVN